MSKKFFDYVIGNPPYQDETLGDNQGFAPPIYNKFMDLANSVAHNVELIHPARFLFNAGSTPKAWNEKMLNDEHFKVMHYEENAANIFPDTDIKGGVAITYHSDKQIYGAIEIFTPYVELNTILKKVIPCLKKGTISDIAISGYVYHFTEKMHDDFPELKKITIEKNGKNQPLLSKGHEYDLKSNIIEKLPMVFSDEKSNNSDCICIIGRANNERVKKYIKREYVCNVINLDKFKLFLPKAIGVGKFGEGLGQMFLATPGMGHTETFFSIGVFECKDEAENLRKYLTGKFSRTLLSVLKKTQNVTPGNFTYVPLQDFTSSSDIDWSKSIHEIDLQLYKKYRLSEDEINFIETNVKELA